MAAPRPPFASDARNVEKDFFAESKAHAASSLAPHEIDRFEDLDRTYVVLGPAVVRRRARLRRFVASIVGVAGVVSVLVGLRLAMRPSHRNPAATPILAAQPALASVDSLAQMPVSSPPATATALHGQQAPDPVPAAPDPNDAPPSTIADAGGAKQAALSAIERGHYHAAIALSRAAIDADPEDADGYLLLGAALQETGRWERAAGLFAECASRAQRGKVSECRALARRW
jgi:tetratricopeptide (TPR) repeat protein